MTKEDLAKFLEAAEQIRKTATASPEAARDFLKKSGYLNEDGSISDHYKSAQSLKND